VEGHGASRDFNWRLRGLQDAAAEPNNLFGVCFGRHHGVTPIRITLDGIAAESAVVLNSLGYSWRS